MSGSEFVSACVKRERERERERTNEGKRGRRTPSHTHERTQARAQAHSREREQARTHTLTRVSKRTHEREQVSHTLKGESKREREIVNQWQLHLLLLHHRRSRPPPANMARTRQSSPDAGLGSEYGTYKTVRTGRWRWISGKIPLNLSNRSLCARTRRSKAHLLLRG